MMNNDEKLIIHIVDEEGNVTEEKEVQYNPYKLTRKKKLELRAKTTIHNYLEIDTEKTTETGNPVVKKFDAKSWQEGRENALDEITRILWGILHISIDSIADVDFEKMREVVEAKDVLGWKRDELETQKKMGV
jgi:hypothetical protein